MEKFDSVEPHIEVANVLFRSGQFQSALDQYTKVLQEIECSIQEQEKSVGEGKEEQSSTRSHVLRSVFVRVLTNCAACYLHLGEWSACVDACSRAVLFDPQRLKAWVRRAEALRHLGKIEAAREDLERAISLDPMNEEVRHLLDEYSDKELISNSPSDQEERLALSTSSSASLTRSIDASDLPLSLSSAGFSFEHSPDGFDSNLLILLHGMGDQHTSMFEFGRKLELPQTAILSLSAPLELPLQLGRWWFPCNLAEFEEIGIERIEEERSSESLCHTCANIHLALDRIVTPVSRGGCGFLPSSVFFFGFGQGACTAIATLISYPSVLGGLVGVSMTHTSILRRFMDSLNPESRPTALDVLFIHGEKNREERLEYVQSVVFRINREFGLGASFGDLGDVSRTSGLSIQSPGQTSCGCFLVTIPNKKNTMIESPVEAEQMMRFFGPRVRLRNVQLETFADAVIQ